MTVKKIIDGLYFTVGMMLLNPLTGESKKPDDLNEDDRTTYNACMGAIELLKAQEPRLLTLEEVKQYNDPVYIECKYRSDWALRCCDIKNTIYFAVGWRNGSSEHFNTDKYGITWRCWTSRPTEEQRKTVKWE